MVKVVSYIVLLFLLFGCHINKAIVGKYNGGTNHWKYSLHLYQDSSFFMTFDGHLAMDTAFGNFSVSSDTVFFYYYTKEDSASAMELVNNFNRPLDSALLLGKSGIRPLTAVVKSNELIYHGFKLKKNDPL